MLHTKSQLKLYKLIKNDTFSFECFIKQEIK